MALEWQATETDAMPGKQELRRIMDPVNRSLEIRLDPHITIERLRELQRQAGIRPEENLLSREILRERYGDG